MKKLLAFLRRLKIALWGQGEIDYIGGSESLPPPLSAEEENYYISRYTGCEEEIKREIECRIDGLISL